LRVKKGVKFLIINKEGRQDQKNWNMR
jgi:hypothetical protein